MTPTTDERLLAEIDRAATLEARCEAEMNDPTLPAKTRIRAQHNHELAANTARELRAMFTRRMIDENP